MKSFSLFSGIGGFDLGFQQSGIETDSLCEIDKNCQNILRRHFPEARLYDDVRKVGINTHERKSIDVVCGGFPCQDLSVAGKRAGLAGERSGLWFEFARVIDELEPQWVVVENVPGLLSSHKGRDFSVILQWLAQRGYGVAWRVLDAQFFGVPQRRRRVFIVGSLGDGRAAEVLFECESLSGNPPPRPEAGQETTGIAGTLSANGGGLDRPAGNANELDFLVADLAQMTSKEHGTRPSEISQPINTLGRMSVFGVAPTIEAEYFIKRYSNQQFFSQNGDGFPVTPMGVRRFTPTECERLQGFPDGWTSGQIESIRYKQLGNAVAVTVTRWLGRRIVESSSK